jgi:thiamine-phosphate diphosphorylase
VIRELARLHVITDDQVLTRSDWTSAASDLLAAGGARLALHVRGPGLPGRTIYDCVRALLGAAERSGAAVLVNDRVDVAMTLPVSGVQLPEHSLPVREARRLLGPDVWIGASVHGTERARAVENDGADYLVVGTVFATPSHPDRPGEGAELLERIARASGLPLVAIGGITPERVEIVQRAGAHGVAVRGGVWNARDPVAAVRAYLEVLSA